MLQQNTATSDLLMSAERKPEGLFESLASNAPFICPNGTENWRLQTKETSQHLCSRDGCKYNFHLKRPCCSFHPQSAGVREQLCSHDKWKMSSMRYVWPGVDGHTRTHTSSLWNGSASNQLSCLWIPFGRLSWDSFPNQQFYVLFNKLWMLQHSSQSNICRRFNVSCLIACVHNKGI